MKDIPNNFVDLTITSPPYDNLRAYNGYVFDFEIIAKGLYRVTKDGGVVVWVVGDATINGSETGTSFRQALYFMECGFKLHDTMIYEKNGTGACGSNFAYWQSFEYMFVFVKGKISTVNRIADVLNKNAGKKRPCVKNSERRERKNTYYRKFGYRTNIWKYNVGFVTNDDHGKHPAVFPEQLAEDHIISWSNPGDLVLDPMCGSGTTPKMAKKNGRDYIGIDISEEYCKIAEERVAKQRAYHEAEIIDFYTEG